MSKAFEMIAAGLEDAIAYMGGETSRGVTHPGVDAKAHRQPDAGAHIPAKRPRRARNVQ